MGTLSLYMEGGEGTRNTTVWNTSYEMYTRFHLHYLPENQKRSLMQTVILRLWRILSMEDFYCTLSWKDRRDRGECFMPKQFSIPVIRSSVIAARTFRPSS